MNSSQNMLSFKQVNEGNWSDLQRLFGEKGAYGGCWCMYWRMKTSEFNSLSPIERKEAMESFIRSGESPGILAYRNERPVGWCSFGPRTEFTRLETSRILKRVDNEEVWSIVCFYIERAHRKTGIMTGLLGQAKEEARKRGARILEGYPIEPKSNEYPDPYAYTGLASAFKKSGFREVARRSEKRPIMRCQLDQPVAGSEEDQPEEIS